MKLNHSGMMALLALAGTALIPQAAKAATVTTVYTQGDLLLGFHQSGTTNDLVVDLGPASNYLNATGAFTISFGVIPGTSTTVTDLSADLTAVFGSSWASNSQTNLVQWGIVGDTDHFANTTFGLPKNTLFLTEAETIPGQGSTPLQRFKATTSGTLDANINSFQFSGTPSYNNSSSTVNSTVATIQPTSQANSWDSFTPNLSAFGTGYNIEQPLTGTFSGPTNSVLDLYELQPNTVNGGDGLLVGNFSLNSSGSLTFTPTPEPSAFAMIGLGVLFLGVRRPRRDALSA